MARRYYVMTLEVDDTPEIDRDGNVRVPGIPVVTSCKRMGLLRRFHHMIFGSRRSVGMFADEAIIEIPASVDVHEIFDYRARNGLVCKVRKQQKLEEPSHKEF